MAGVAQRTIWEQQKIADTDSTPVGTLKFFMCDLDYISFRPMRKVHEITLVEYGQQTTHTHRRGMAQKSINSHKSIQTTHMFVDK